MDNDLLDMIAGEDGSATQIHDKIKEILYNKVTENIDLVKYAVTVTCSVDLIPILMMRKR